LNSRENVVGGCDSGWGRIGGRETRDGGVGVIDGGCGSGFRRGEEDPGLGQRSNERNSEWIVSLMMKMKRNMRMKDEG
jgi:hypothetical protein